MRIGIDMLAVRREKTGVGQYAVNVVREMAVRHSEDTLVVFSGAAIFGTRSPIRRVLYEQLVLPGLLDGENDLDVVFCPTNVLPLLVRKPAVLTIHDLSFMGYPRKFPLLNRLYYHVMYRLSARRALMIVAISNHTKADLVRWLGVPPDKVKVVYPGISERFRREYDAEIVRQVLEKHDVRKPYVLFVGTLDPGKNAVSLIEAYARLVGEFDARYNLVVVGQQGRHYRQAFDAVRRLGLEGKVLFTGFVPDDELPSFYRAAALFVFPSLYEGFGLPVVEAMACGTPVVASNSSSLAEVAGDAALLFDPLDVNGMFGCMRRVLEDDAFRRELGARGMERARAFSWTAAAEEIHHCLVEVYRNASALR